MGKFKAPFSSQRSQDDSDIRTFRTAANVERQETLSPLHIGRVTVITPQTKNKIKRRFAGLANQQHHVIKATSPGVFVPFDLSQSQSVISQPIKSAGHGIPSMYLGLQDNADANELPVDNDHASHIGESQINSELYIDFGEEEGGTGSQIQAADVTKITDKAQGNLVLSADVDTIHDVEKSKISHCTKPRNGINFSSAGQEIMNPGIKRSRKHTRTKLAQKQKSRVEHFDDDLQDEETWCEGNQKVIRYLSSLPQALNKPKKRINNVQLKKDVLQIIFKMHQEIETLNRRRAKLLQGKCSSSKKLKMNVNKTTIAEE